MRTAGTILLLFAFLMETELTAQNQKIGFVDSEVIIEQMPEYAGIEQRLNLLSESWRDEIREMEQEIEQLREEFNAREVLYTDEIREQRLAEINTLVNRKDQHIQEKFGPDGEYFQRQQELLEPIQRQLFDAINQVANRESFDFIFDRSEDIRFLFARSEWNITDDVLLELGIQTDPLRN